MMRRLALLVAVGAIAVAGRAGAQAHEQEHLPLRARAPLPGKFPAGLAPYAFRAGGPAHGEADRRFDRLVDEFVLFHLRADPVHATRLGFHDYDALVPATDSAGLDSVAAAYAGFRERFSEIPAEGLGRERRADLERTTAALRDGGRDRCGDSPWRRDPNVYLDLSSNAIRSLFDTDVPPLEERASNVVARVNEISRILANARGNLRDCPRSAVEGAIRKVGALAEILSNDLPVLWEPVRDPVLREEFDHHLAQAAGAAGEFRHWLRTELLPRASAETTWNPEGEARRTKGFEDAVAVLVRRGDQSPAGARDR